MMADHAVTDLSYGHLGKASYDTEENEWKFSVDLNNRSSIEQIAPFKGWFTPSTRQTLHSEHKSFPELKTQRQWLAKSRPETFAADPLAAELNKVDLSKQKDLSPQIGSLLAVARAVDPDRVSGSRTTQVLAVPYGDADHILRLIRPRVEVRGWEKRGAARLTLLDSESPDYGYWIGEGGIIRQILASDTDNGSGTWLAVRQDTATTIFRPQYGRLHDATTISNGIAERFPISRVNPNPVATLTVERTRSRAHADVTFNPWYARQFAVVDTSGLWSIWDLETTHGKGASQKLVPGKRGSIYDDYTLDPFRKPEDYGHADGWYRILWVCNLSTIVVCNRRHIALLNLRDGTSSLQTTNILPPTSHDWILDIKRSTTSNSHLFVLTTSRMFWVKVVPNDGGASALDIVMSYRHFRNSDDETLRLTVLRDTSVSVLITSSANPLVQFYCFLESEEYDIPVSYQGSFDLSHNEQHEVGEDALSSTCFLPCLLALSSSARLTGAGGQYVEKNVRFFQVWSFSTYLGLRSSVVAAQHWTTNAVDKRISVTAPSLKVGQSSRRFGSKVIEESFIVPDGEEDEDGVGDTLRGNMQHDLQAMLSNEWEDDIRFRIDWRKIYQYAFGLDKSPAQDNPSIRDLLAQTSNLIQQGLETDELPTTTLIELSGFETVSEDIEGASQALQEFLQSLESEMPTALTVSSLIPSDDQDFMNESSQHPEMWRLYDKMAEYWMSSLPSDLANEARVARYKFVQQLAMDVCLSSVCLSIQNKSVSVEELPQENDMEELPHSTNDRGSRESSPGYFSSQLAAITEEPRIPFPTPSKTPSEYSHTTSGSEVKEDPAITRLRQYARSIKAKPDLGPPSILSHWPLTPGFDPALYSCEESTKAAAAAAESGNESEHRNRKEEARRRRRTEKFLRQKGSRAVETAAQSILHPSGSQPAASNNLASSQSVADLPMTQPVLGAFGSRKGEKDKQKSKKRRTAGFR